MPIKQRFSLALVTLFFAGYSHAAVIANSIGEFSATQGSDNWHYGFYNLTADASPGYQTAEFVAFDTFSAGAWRASAAQVGAGNNEFLQTNDIGGHPNGLGPDAQDANVWAMRRYVSEVAGLIDILFDLRKFNTGNPRGNGITGRIFVDGVEVYTEVVGNADGVANVQLLNAIVAVGSVIDFAIDPTGTGDADGSGIASARADGTHFSAVIREHAIPVPGTLVLLTLGIGLVLRRSR